MVETGGCTGLDSRAGLEVGARSSTASPLKGGTMIPMKSWWAIAPWWAPGSDGKFPQGRLGNMGNAIGEYWKWEMNSLFVLLFDTLMSISQAQMLMGDYQVAKMECVYVCLADDVEKV